MNETIYETLEKTLTESDARILKACLGMTWSFCEIESIHRPALGFAQTPGLATRTLTWPGNLRGSFARDYALWITSWDFYQATLALALCNAQINHDKNPLYQQSEIIEPRKNANLAIFEYFLPKIKDKNVVIIGRYPGIESLDIGEHCQIIERHPAGGDLPDPAAEYLLPNADWVFISATSLINKTFPRLAELSQHAVSVLMGPSVPLLTCFEDYAIDYLAGIQVRDAHDAMCIAMEGGGTKLFEESIRYVICDISDKREKSLKQEIASTYAKRDNLKKDMESWYLESKNGSKKFPGRSELDKTDTRLSRLDTAYKRLWDAKNSGDKPCL